MLNFRNIIENKTNLNSARDVKDFLDTLYEEDVPSYEDYIKIIKSFKKYPAFMDDIKYSKGKYNSVIGTEKTGLKRKFLFEIDGNFLKIYKQEKPRQRIKDYKFYKDYNLDELF